LFFKLSVFIHRSIKTRIETGGKMILKKDETLFLYIDPLKQGLKLNPPINTAEGSMGFYT